MGELLINIVGVRNGEFITNRVGAKQNTGTILQLRGFYPPSRVDVNAVDELVIRDTASQIPFFAPMTLEQRLGWLLEHSTAKNDLYMEDVSKVHDVPNHPTLPELHIKFIKIGGDFFTKRTKPGVLDELIRGNPADLEGYWPISEVLLKFSDPKGQTVTGKASGKGIRGGKHTLIFRPHNWVVMPTTVKPTTFNGMHFDLDTLQLGTGSISAPAGGSLRVFKVEKFSTKMEYAVVTAHVRQNALTWDYLLTLCGAYAKEMEEVKPLIAWFPPALYKSLIQKLIRTRCRQVEYAGKTYSAGATLLTALCLLMLDPGAFVPNIQRHVGGMESAFKRLAVSIAEDGYLEDGRYLALLFICATIAQHDKSWQPTDHVIMWMLQVALLAQQDPRIYDYDWHNFSGLKEWNPLSLCYMLLGELGSFDSDIKMLGSIAEREGKARTTIVETIFLETMPLIHCVDQHTYTEIGNYMPYTGQPYTKLFDDIWSKVVGVNPRLERYKDWNKDDPFVQMVRVAQRQLWIAKIHTPQPRPILRPEGNDEKSTTVEFRYNLDPSWLAGLVGPLEVKSYKAVVVLRTDDIYRLTAIKVPSRDDKVAELTEDEKEAAVHMAYSMLEQGIKLKHVPNTLAQFQGATVYLRGDEYYLVDKEQKVTRWSDAIALTYELPIHPGPREAHYINDALLYTGDGIMERADDIFDALIKATPEAVLRRLATYIEGARSKILLHKIGRKGEGVDYVVSPEDSGVFHLLCGICCLYPAALVKASIGFTVKLGPLMWSLRDKIFAALHDVKHTSGIWTPPAPDARQMREHQHDIFQTMRNRHLRNKRGNLLWVPVGMGKSYNVTAYIHWLIERDEMPAYCVWTLPPSAVDGIKRELDLAHLPHQVLDMRLAGTIKTLTRGMVNIVLHDHMRMNGLDEQLKALAPHMLFVIDEFHKTINPTKRTSITLEVVRLSADFVGLSGTIIKDTHTEELIQWLETIVDFEVTEHNYWVAIGALISKKAHTNVVVDRVPIEAKLLNPDHYNSLVPKSLGGTAANLNFQAAINECYEAITVEMIKQILFYVNAGEGVFVCATNTQHQKQLETALNAAGVTRIHLITKNTPITLTANDPRTLQVVITTKQHVEGYTLTQFRIMIQPVLLSNQATREQLEGRLNRIGQPSPIVRYIVIHCGILSHIMKHYEKARTLSAALKGFAKDIEFTDIAALTSLD